MIQALRQAPVARGDEQQQLNDIRDYLNIISRYVMTTGETAAAVVQEVYNASVSGTPAAKGTGLQPQAELKSLIQKTADAISYDQERFDFSLSSKYLAKSEFGEYFENARVDISGTPVGIEQLYSYSSGIRSDFDDVNVSANTYIKTGLLYYDDIVPVYGVAVGDIQTTVDVGGNTIIDRGDLVGTFTPDEIAFWRDGNKRLYITEDDVYMPSAQITAGSGAFSGEITATSGDIGGCQIVNGHLQVPGANITGRLVVGDADDPLFDANITDGSVHIGIFAVNALGALESFSEQLVQAINMTYKGDDNNRYELLANPQSIRISHRYRDSYTTWTYRENVTYDYSGIYFAYEGHRGNCMEFHDDTYGGSVTLYGTWHGSVSQSTVSDINHKRAIEALPDRYSDLFDALLPVRYKYNDGTSNRYHTGFIAQDVADALTEAGIPTSDFAGYIRSEDGEGNVTCYLRYEEFISLCVKEIQKLKARVNALEGT